MLRDSVYCKPTNTGKEMCLLHVQAYVGAETQYVLEQQNKQGFTAVVSNVYFSA